MGRAGKARKHGAKMRAKRAAKAQRKAAYSALAGTSKKNKKLRRKSEVQHKHEHRIDYCGNVGCALCFPQFARAKQSPPTSTKNYYQRKMRAA